MKEWFLWFNHIDNKNNDDLDLNNSPKELRDLMLDIEWLKLSIEETQKSWLDQVEKDRIIEESLNKLEEIQSLYSKELALSKENSSEVQDELESIKSSVVYNSSKQNKFENNTNSKNKEMADIERNNVVEKMENIVSKELPDRLKLIKNMAA